MRGGSLGREDSLKKEMATHSSIFVWNPTDRGAWRTTVHGVAKSWTQLKGLSKYKEISVHPCSQQHYSQQLEHGSNPRDHQWMNG